MVIFNLVELQGDYNVEFLFVGEGLGIELLFGVGLGVVGM